MGKTYSVPRSVKGESRILIIFSVKSLIFTIAFGLVGVLIYFVLSFIGLGVIGFGVIITLAIIGYIIGALVIPDSPLIGNLRKAGGEAVSDILFRTITFRNRKKIYVYRDESKKEGEKK